MKTSVSILSSKNRYKKIYLSEKQIYVLQKLFRYRETGVSTNTDPLRLFVAVGVPTFRKLRELELMEVREHRYHLTAKGLLLFREELEHERAVNAPEPEKA